VINALDLGDRSVPKVEVKEQILSGSLWLNLEAQVTLFSDCFGESRLSISMSQLD